VRREVEMPHFKKFIASLIEPLFAITWDGRKAGED